MSKHRDHRGFTLIEVMIVVAIVAILSALIVPAYRDYILRANRTHARAGLQNVALWMERGMTANGAYTTDSNIIGPYSFPRSMRCVPDNPADNQNNCPAVTTYEISFTLATQTAYTLKATPFGKQEADACGSFTLTHTGQRGVTGGTETNAATCWNK